MMRPAFDPLSLEQMKARLRAAVEASEPEPSMLIGLKGCDRCRDSGSPGYISQKRRSQANRHELIDVLTKCECQRPPAPPEGVGGPSDAVRAAARAGGGRRR